MKNFKCLFTIVFIIAAFSACKEDNRFAISSKDTTIPGAPTLKGVIPLYGGARIYYTPPTDEDLLLVCAEIDAPNGKAFKFSASYFKDSLDVFGLGEMKEYTIRLYAEDRAGNKSSIVPVKVIPLESTIQRVAKNIAVKPGFNAFYLDWYNELKQTINVIVEFEFTMGGTHRNLIQVLSSNLEYDRQFVKDLVLGPTEPINMKIRIEDIYGNITAPIVVNNMVLLQDSKIPKADWVLPITNDSIAGIPMCFGNAADGRIWRVIDDIVDYRDNTNYMNCQDRGRTGVAGIANANLWNLIIDLGDYYELSRIITNQRHSGGTLGLDRGQFYKEENVGHYKLYYLDEAANQWVFISEHYIPIPIGMTDIEFIKYGQQGDEEYMYPDNPGFTPPVRWFRYEAISGFDANYTNQKHNCLSEVTLFGRKPSGK